jgi:predicted nucleic acid-binding protein
LFPLKPQLLCSGPRQASSTGASVPTSTLPPGRIRRLVADNRRRQRGVLDTSVIIDLENLDASALPREVAVSAITLAELAAGPHATTDPDERARRQDRLQRAEAAFDPLPFDGGAARAYGRIFASVAAAGRKARGARAVDLLIAATALAAGAPLYTRNGEDFRAIDDLVDIVVV